MTKEAVVYLDKEDFITLMRKWGLIDDIASIAALFGKSAQSVYKYLNLDSDVEIPLVVVRHIESLMGVDANEVNALITKLIETPLDSSKDIGAYFEFIDGHQIEPTNENLGIIFGKSTPTIYRATVTKKYDPAMAAHLRTLKSISDELVDQSIDEAFRQLEEEVEES
tara:strand:+ start:7507 stop:8007 length:501 start_codon:yes stop_codon:yes gene_type:complete